MRIQFTRLLAAAITTSSLLVAWGTASAAPYVLVAWHQRPAPTGTLASLFFRSGTAQGCPSAPPYKQPCYNPNNAFVVAQGLQAQVETAGLATWDWNGTTLTGTGLLWATSLSGAASLGAAIISDKVTNLAITPTTATTTASTYQCIEGGFLASVGVHGCLNISLGTNNVLDSTGAYNVGGDANCVTRTILPDDALNPNSTFPGPRGLFTAPAGGGCEAVAGAFDQWFIVANPRFLVLATVPSVAGSDGCYMFGRASEQATVPANCASDASLANASYLIFAPKVDTDSDGVVDALDNCRTLANATQVDSNGDGFGNRCDGDLNNNGSTNAQDTVLFRAQLGQPSVAPTYNAADINANGAVNASDTTLYRQLLSAPPGPSGLCNNTFPCPAHP